MNVGGTSMNVTVYLGAHEGNNPVYKQAVAELAIWIAENGHRLVYGGSNEGLMAVIADVRGQGCRAQESDPAHHRAEHHRTAYSHDRAWRRVHRLPRRHGNVGGDQ